MKTLLLGLALSVTAMANTAPEYTCRTEKSGVQISFTNGLQNWSLPGNVEIKVKSKTLDVAQQGAFLAPANSFAEEMVAAEISVSGAVLRNGKLDGDFRLVVIQNKNEEVAEGVLELSSKKLKLNLKNEAAICTIK